MFIKFRLIFRFVCDFRSSACERVKTYSRVSHTNRVRLGRPVSYAHDLVFIDVNTTNQDQQLCIVLRKAVTGAIFICCPDTNAATIFLSDQSGHAGLRSAIGRAPDS